MTKNVMYLFDALPSSITAGFHGVEESPDGPILMAPVNLADWPEVLPDGESVTEGVLVVDGATVTIQGLDGSFLLGGMGFDPMSYQERLKLAYYILALDLPALTPSELHKNDFVPGGFEDSHVWEWEKSEFTIHFTANVDVSTSIVVRAKTEQAAIDLLTDPDDEIIELVEAAVDHELANEEITFELDDRNLTIDRTEAM